MWDIIVKAFSILFIIFLGYVLKRIGKFRVEDRTVISNMVFVYSDDLAHAARQL